MFDPFLRRFLEQIPMEELTKTLDVKVFAKAIGKPGLPNGRRVELINE
jgi:hypothetical protein